MDFYIFVTKACNLKCTYCFQRNAENFFQNETGCPDVKKTAEFVVKNLGKGRNNVTFYGGEPLLNQDWIKKFIGLMREEDLHFTLQTNATLLEKIDNFILENLDFIHVSIDGSQQVTDASRGEGTFALVLDNIKKTRPKFKGELLARLTFMPGNSIYNSVVALLDLNLFDCFYWQLQNSPFAVDFQKAKNHYSAGIGKLADFWIKSLEERKKLNIIPFQAVALSFLSNKQFNSYRCGAGTYLVTIDSDGSCYSCDELLVPEFRIGDINEGIQQKPLHSANRSDFCSLCDIAKICGGRCFRASFFSAQKFKFYCDMTKILVNAIQEKMPKINSLLQENKIGLKDLEPKCFTEEMP